MRRTVIKTSVLPSGTEEIWEKLQQLSTLRYIAAPLAAFTPTDGDGDLAWRSGETYRFYFKLFGVISLGVHTIRVLTFDKNWLEIFTNEGNPFVPVWNHRIKLKAIDERQTRYTDEVEIDAGWKTFFIYLWAKIFYAYRQRRWLKLLRSDAARPGKQR